MSTEAPSGLMSLINRVEYNGFKIKEWSIVQFAKLTPVLSEIAEEYDKKDIQFSSFAEVLENASAEGALGLSKSALTFLSPVLSKSKEILKVSLNITDEQVEQIPFSDGLVLVLLSLKINMEHLSSFFVSLVRGVEEKKASISSVA